MEPQEATKRVLEFFSWGLNRTLVSSFLGNVCSIEVGLSVSRPVAKIR